MSQALIGLATLARKAFRSETLSPISEALLARLAADENDANALLDLSMVLYLSGQAELAHTMQKETLKTQRVFRLPNSLGLPEAQTLRVLVFMVPGDLTRNTAIEFLTEGTPTTLDLVYVEPGKALPSPLPDHDIAFVAICESAANELVLHHLAGLTQNWPHPLINPPERLAAMSRDRISQTLKNLPGLHIPLFARIARPELGRLTQLGPQDALWPLIIRPIDSHKGQGLARLSNPAELVSYLSSSRAEEFFLAPFVDYRSADGLYRKYRVVLIDGHPWVCHQCMSEHWMQHYMSAGMTEDSPAGEAKRREEAACFAQFNQPGGFAQRHAEAFRAIYETLDLPYIGLDCSELPDGQLLIFEVDCGMTVHAMDDETLHPYKPAQMRAVFAAFHAMLQRHCQAHG